ncbi:hypothetical protein LTR35_011064 [Friedmanniomyces endolithicus]|uniref:Uncharacterized protein n=1 Tax=Friedmanniomyces endolithicus TaxID=329885 RepID=A0AAN6FUR6_9PEZI|nr:hypothetical protein LTR35_011064 [Friedmanniomyces endolithicus]KAK0299640.1 hypothetical protein LTS00_002085 [Friedmanniomyces endolithicus]KAK0323691.1 hypothetical protein LTR82_005438 [Friedmanniomyces endolithicus]
MSSHNLQLISQKQALSKRPSFAARQVSTESLSAVPQRDNSTGRAVTATWLLEILAATISLASVAGLVIFLRAIDDKPYSSWHIVSVEITPNTLLSLLSTICKASFLSCVSEGLSQMKWNYFHERERRLLDLQHFDAASRGQLGALRLMWSINYRALLANLGAIVVVLAIATDPLTNQIITVRTRPTTTTNATASIGAAYAYGLQAKNSLTSISAPLSDAMLRGIYAPALQVAYSCPSGSCAWPAFESLGFCSTCQEVSDEVTVQCGNCEPNKPQPGSSSDLYSSAMCNYTTPGGINASVQLQSTDGATVTTDTFLETMISDLGSMAGNESNRLNVAMDESGSIVQLNALRFDQEYPMHGQRFEDYVCGLGNSSSLPMIRPKAYSCTLGWCVNSFAATRFEDGGLIDAATSSHPLKMASEHCYVPADRQAPGNRLLCPTYRADQPMPRASALSIPGGLPSSQGGAVYWINDIVTTNIQAYIDDTFDFSIGGNRPANNGDNGVNLVTSPALQQTFYTANGGNVSQTLTDIARSMTNEVRQGPESAAIFGSVAYEVAFIQVRWVWIIYLAALCGTAVLFLLGAIVTTWRQEAPVWKSSVLPLLFNSREPGVEAFEQLDARDAQAMEKLAKDIKAHLGSDNILCCNTSEKTRRV